MPDGENLFISFLATYGWAILIVLIFIGALAYFGVLNPPDTKNCECKDLIFTLEFKIDEPINLNNLSLLDLESMDLNFSDDDIMKEQLSCQPYKCIS